MPYYEFLCNVIFKILKSQMITELDNGLMHFAELVLDELGIDIQHIAGAGAGAGAGAAGGLGAAFAGFLHANLQSGIELVLDMIKMEKNLAGVDFVITGEGKIDGQTFLGKAPLGVAKLAQSHQIRVIALAGSIADETDVLNTLGITSIFSIVSSPMTLKEAMDPHMTFKYLRRTTNQLFRMSSTSSKG